MNAVGGNIKSLRIRARISREELAKRVGVSVRDVSMWERRTAQPDIETLGDIAQALGVDINEVIYGQTEADPKKIRKQWMAFIVFGTLFILLLVSSFWFKEYALNIRKTFFDSTLSHVYIYIWRPLIYMLASVFAMSGISLMGDFRIISKIARYIFLLAGIAFLLLYLSGCIECFFCGPWKTFLPETALYMALTPQLFLLPGLCLYLGIKK